MQSKNRLRVLELFCGIGGCAAALDGNADVVAAIDINHKALAVYRENFSHPTRTLAIESIAAETLARWEADLWWMSPPCQPYTVRGQRRDIHDARAASFLSLIDKLPQIKPTYLALENVPGFEGSKAQARLREVLTKCGYSIREILLCPTQLGVANRRRRFYCVAARAELHDWPTVSANPALELRCCDVVRQADYPELEVPREIIAAYEGAVHVVAADDPEAVTCCFTSSYGRSMAASGSYLRTKDIYRRFSPAEILGLLGFPPTFHFPEQFTALDAWPLVGNSLSIPAVRYVLSCIPELSVVTV